MKKERRNFCFFALVLLLLLLVFYLPWLNGQQSFYISDLTYYFEPLSGFIGDGLRHGHWPIWNPLSFCGMPQIAVPSPGVFYPFTWLSAVLSFSPALALSMIAHQWIAGIGGYLLIGSFGWGAFPAAVCGLVLSLCGYMFSLQSNYTLIDTAAWIPLSLWSVRKFGDNTGGGINVPAMLMTSFSIFMMISAGRPEIFLPGLLLVVAYCVISGLNSYLLDRRGRKSIITLVGSFSAIACGVLLSMPSVLPPLEWACLSTRAHGLGVGEIFIWSSNWYDFVGMLLPQPLGDLNELGAKFLPAAAARSNYIPYVPSAYLGPIVFTLALWGLSDGSWRYRHWVLLMLLGSLIMTLGDYTPISPWLCTNFHFLGIFRYPEKLLIFFLGAVAMLAARGAFISWQKGPPLSARVIAFVVWGILLLISAVLSLSSGLSWLTIQSSKWSGSGIGLELLGQSQALIGQSGLRAAVVGLAVCILGELLRRRQLASRTYAALILSALAATLLAGAWLSSRHGVEPGFFEHPSYMKMEIRKLMVAQPDLPGFRVVSLFFDPVTYPENWKGIAGEAKTPSFYQYGRQLLLPNAHLDAGLPCSYGYESAETSQYRKLFWSIYGRSHAFESQGKGQAGKVSDMPLYRFCQMTSTGYAYSQVYKGHEYPRDITKLDPELFTLAVEDRAMNLRIYKVQNSLPRVFFPKSWSFVDSDTEAIQTVIDSDINNFDPREKTILVNEKTAPQSGASAALEQTGAAGSSTAKYELSTRDAEHLAIKVSLEKPALMVLADQNYPGWLATIDGHAAKIWTANGILRAVFVPLGRHTVQFAYCPQSLAIALLLAGLALLFLSIAVLSNLAGRIKSRLVPDTVSAKAEPHI